MRADASVAAFLEENVEHEAQDLTRFQVVSILVPTNYHWRHRLRHQRGSSKFHDFLYLGQESWEWIPVWRGDRGLALAHFAPGLISRTRSQLLLEARSHLFASPAAPVFSGISSQEERMNLALFLPDVHPLYRLDRINCGTTRCSSNGLYLCF